MGICMCLKRLTDASRERMLADSNEISLCFDFSDGESDNQSPERDPHFDEPECNLDKTWQTLCFLCCGENLATRTYVENSFPSNFMLPLARDGITMSDDLFGGPAWIYSSQVVKEIADFLDAQVEDQLRAKYLPEAVKIAKAYSSYWNQVEYDQSPAWEEDWRNTFDEFSELKKFVRETADRHLALLLYLS